MPMAAGAMRMMLDAYRKMDVQIAESRRTFAAMSPQARQEFVESALVDYRAMAPEEQKAYGMMINGNFFGMPDDMQGAVKAAISAGA